MAASPRPNLPAYPHIAASSAGTVITDGNGVTTALRRDEGRALCGTKNMTVNTANNLQKAKYFPNTSPSRIVRRKRCF